MDLKNEKILIVDDNPHIINKIVEILSENNSDYTIYQANNGDIAYKIAEAKLPDLIVTDWDMPVLNGIELIKKLKENTKTKEIPVIMATAVMLTSEDLKSALVAGAVDYIRKPIDPIELFARVRSVLKISEYNKVIIENKNKEIAESTLFLIRNNKFNIQLIKKLQELHEIIDSQGEEIVNLFEFMINSIEEKVREDSWQKFELSIKSSNDEFTKHLLIKFPDLTNTEIKLCIFLKLGMNTKDIAAALYQSPDSVKVARSRLRKKIDLPTGTNLTNFLTSI